MGKNDARLFCCYDGPDERQKGAGAVYVNKSGYI